MQARPLPTPTPPAAPMQEPDEPLEFPTFLPPADFAAHARVTDPASTRRPRPAPAWWATGQAVVAYVTVGGGTAPGPGLAGELREHVPAQIGKFARPRRVIWAADLPKTRSGKIMRRPLRDIAGGRELGEVSTLADPSVVAALQQAAEGSER